MDPRMAFWANLTMASHSMTEDDFYKACGGGGLGSAWKGLLSMALLLMLGFLGAWGGGETPGDRDKRLTENAELRLERGRPNTAQNPDDR